MFKFQYFLPFFCYTMVVFSADWPKFGGSNGTFFSEEKGLRSFWGNEEPEILWKLDAGFGYSSIIESDGKAFTKGYNEGKINLICVDVSIGKIIWKKAFPCPRGDNYFKGGSRSTPVIDGDNLFVLLHNGDFYCLDSQSGKILWNVNVVEDLGGTRPTWGFAASPMILGKKVILPIGGEKGGIIALDREQGEVLWRAGKYGASYSTPFKSKKEDHIIIFHDSGLSIHDVGDGRELFTYPHKTRYGINASQPLEFGKNIFISSAYGKGSALIDFSGKIPKTIWKTDKISAQMSSSILKEDHIYGIHGQAGGHSKFSTIFCLNANSGRIAWQKKGYGLGSLIMVRETIIFLSESGEIALIRATPDKFEELASFQLLSGKDNWIPPSYANGRLHCRSSDGNWICVKMGADQ